ncbi:OLC1v1014144C1 [Oldenlandia corymbosa var. corymbosa]|uniref:OLC1v1014144C1 n=1 Tax=Oldenlandia corymbosa var. corymbosa TaxID=529605 RepID=A0AAV1E0D3_OLDCO|nr:OLC1v1014144C1 [Oldenlandia corymbosa var. corymbosa]
MIRPRVFILYLLPLLFSIFQVESNGLENETFVYCSTSKCGNHEVRYPFWIKNNASTAFTHCGYQGFGLDLDCFPPPPKSTTHGDQHDWALFLSLPYDFLFVKNINCIAKILTLVDLEVQHNITCLKASHSLTFEDLPLGYNRADLNLTFYFNCTRPLTFSNDSTPMYRIDCLC